MTTNDTLFIITARGGSKGVPGKNIRLLGNKPLIGYTVDVAKELTSDEHICVSTDSTEIRDVVERYGLAVPFLRPEVLARDNSGSYEVLLHAVEFYKAKGIHYNTLVLLQPTSPFRSARQVKEAIDVYYAAGDIDMVVSVTEVHDNPYFNLFEQNEEGYLRRSKPGNYTRRQDCPPVYAYNGAIYVINIASLLKKNLGQFEKIRKYVMDKVSSVDIDTPLDWLWAEFILSNSREIKLYNE